MASSSPHTPAARFFQRVVRRPRLNIGVAVALILACGIWLPALQRDASSEAFIAPDHAAVRYRQHVAEVFGLADPIVVLICRDGPDGVFNPRTLYLVNWLTRQIQDPRGRLPAVNARRVTSLATEHDITGTEEGLISRPPLLEARVADGPDALTPEEARRVRDAVMDVPLYVGNLVGAAGDATVIIVELHPSADADRAYRDILALTEAAPVVDEKIHVAGEGAVSAQLGRYIDKDMFRLNILCGIVITTVLYFSYRTVRGILLPWFVVGGAVAVALGLMAASGERFYIITNALPVILIAIGVADGVHILGRYYEQVALSPDAPAREIVVRTMTDMWRPVTVTSLTDIAGFLAIYAASLMPPMKGFGLYTAIGSAAAWLLSMLVLPAWLVLLPPRASRAFAARGGAGAGVAYDRVGRAIGRAGALVTRHTGPILAAAALVVAAGAFGAARLTVDEQRVANFKAGVPIREADELINDRMNGTSHLDIVVETTEEEGILLKPALRRIAAIQDHLLELPHVGGAASIVDYVKQMHRAYDGGSRDAYRLPDHAFGAAQLFQMAQSETDAGPDEFEHVIDHLRQSANIRLSLKSGRYSHTKVIVEEAQRFIAEQSDTDGGPPLTASLAGRVNVDYHWIRVLARGHVRSVTLALMAVGLMLAISFRSAYAGGLALIPVAMAVLLIYAVMGFTGIWLSTGTTMFAAIAIGIGVDFAVHSLDRTIVLVRHEGRTLEEAMTMLFPTTGRALLFSFTAVLLGFGLLVTSHVPPLIRFGVLVTVSIAASFLASLTVLPAVLKALRPSFLIPPARPAAAGAAAGGAAVALAALLSQTVVHAETTEPAETSETAETARMPEAPPTGDQIARRINARDDGRAVTRRLVMEMVDRHDRKRTRVTTVLRRNDPDAKRTLIFYHAPASVKGTGFLNVDYVEPGRDDDRWIYLPAMRKVRRIAASDRGDYFFGTDFTYEDINNETKVNVADYSRRYLRPEDLEGVACLVMEANPIDEKAAAELGYSRVVSWVDPRMWMLRRADYFDLQGRALKTIHFRDVRLVQEKWTAHVLEAINHLTDHRTILRFEDVRYSESLDDDLFTLRTLRRGL